MTGPAGGLPPLRVGLERGYDYGRHGAWLLDLPGAFVWAGSPDLALSQASGGMGWFRDWLGRHGEPADGLWGRPVVVEEVPASIVDGYERNATFEDDRRPVSWDEVETAIRRLAYARDDLLDLASRVSAFEASGGELAGMGDRDPNQPNDAAGERTADQVLRHVGAAEMWLAGRLDGARFEGVARDVEAGVWLEATRAWTVDRLRELGAGAAASGGSRIDGKGEEWTLRKVVRRLLYHSIDHFRELDLRLARAEGRADRLRYSRERLDAVAPLIRLLRAVGWDRRTTDADKLARALQRSLLMVSAWDGDELVGYARELGDGVIGSTVAMVVVDPRWQGLGIAERLIRMIMDGRDDVRFTLGAAPGLEPFYARLGFEMDSHAMIRPASE